MNPRVHVARAVRRLKCIRIVIESCGTTHETGQSSNSALGTAGIRTHAHIRVTHSLLIQKDLFMKLAYCKYSTYIVTWGIIKTWQVVSTLPSERSPSQLWALLILLSPFTTSMEETEKYHSFVLDPDTTRDAHALPNNYEENWLKYSFWTLWCDNREARESAYLILAVVLNRQTLKVLREFLNNNTRCLDVKWSIHKMDHSNQHVCLCAVVLLHPALAAANQLARLQPE
jgi:hypothetical protein